MSTRKQEIYCQLLRDGILEVRGLCARGDCVIAECLPELCQALEVGWELANFLHNVPSSILEPGYVDNDLTFINWAFPHLIERLGDRLRAEIAPLMLEFYEGVPDNLRAELTWHPSIEFRAMAGHKPA